MSEIAKKNVLLQGFPRVGKTTIIKKLVARVASAGGFITEEIREGSIRRGFRIATLEGKHGILAYEGRPSPYRVGKYGVDIGVLESVGVESVRDALTDMSKRLVVIDEIGKMELFSSRFQEVVLDAFQSPKMVLATAPTKGNAFVEKLKSGEMSRLISVTADNRDGLPDKILAIIMNA